MIRHFDDFCRDNWVDDNNCFVGFDVEGHCCETFGSFWFTMDGDNFGLHNWSNDNDYVWDTSWFLSSDDAYSLAERLDAAFALPDTEWNNTNNYYALNYGSTDYVFFRATGRSGDVYLVLYNSHNGYYCHGWDFGVNNSNGTTTTISSGSL